MSKKVSIVVAAYNEEKHISKCLESLIKQTYNNIEIIVVDDGSIDSTSSVVKKYVEKDSRIKLFVQKNAGLASARNSGLKLVTGDYVGFCDGDDYVEANMYEELLKKMFEEEVDIVCCGMKFVSELGKPLNYFGLSDRAFRIDIKDNFYKYYDMFIDGRDGIYSVCNKLYNYKILIDNKVQFPPNKRSDEDVEFNLNYSKYVNSFLYIPSFFYNYRMTGQSITRGYVNNALERHIDWIEIILKYLPWAKSDSDRMLKLRKLSAENLIFSITKEVIYKGHVNLCTYMKRALEINEYKRAYLDIDAKMISSRYNRILWQLLKAKKYRLLIIAIKIRYNLVRLKNNVLN